MRVRDLHLYHVRLPLRRPLRHASHTRTATDNLVVECVLADGTTGWGEGVPRDYVTGETIDDAYAAVEAAPLRAQLHACTSIDEALAMIERVELPPVPGDDRRCQRNAARCAVELALLDAYGRAFGESFTSVAQRVAPDVYAFSPHVHYSGVIASSQGFKLRALAWGMRLLGFRHVKLKVGVAGQDDVARVRAVRRRVGPRRVLRLDANEAWQPDQAVAILQQLKPFAIDCIEQPLPHEQAARLPEVRAAGVPVMLDESLCGTVDAERAVAGGWCDRFNLRLSKVGGFLPALRLAQYAKRHGIGCQLGCQVGESRILGAAGRHFASAVGGLHAVEGAYDRWLLAANVGEHLRFGHGGVAPALPDGGHGGAADPDALAAVTVREGPIRG